MVYYENIYSEDIAIEGKSDGMLLLKMSLETMLFSLVLWIHPGVGTIVRLRKVILEDIQLIFSFSCLFNLDMNQFGLDSMNSLNASYSNFS